MNILKMMTILFCVTLLTGTCATLTSAAPITERAAGSSGAPILFEVFLDLECPYCDRWYLKTMPQIMDNYGEHIYIVFRHYPLSFHENSFDAALATECAAEQKMFFPYLDMLMTHPWYREYSELIDLAEDTGMNREWFISCMDSQHAEDAVHDDIEYGDSIGVYGTPTFFINDIRIEGSQPYEVFEAVIEQELYG